MHLFLTFPPDEDKEAYYKTSENPINQKTGTGKTKTIEETRASEITTSTTLTKTTTEKSSDKEPPVLNTTDTMERVGKLCTFNDTTALLNNDGSVEPPLLQL